MKSERFRIPMNATRAVRLAKVLKEKDITLPILLEQGLKNLENRAVSSSRKV